MKILFLPNWHVHSLIKDQKDIQAPDKYINGGPYWFFKYFPNTEVDVFDFQPKWVFHNLEKRYLKNYFYQCWKGFLRRKKYDVVISHGAQSGLFYSLLTSIFRTNKNPLHVIIDIGGMNGARINKIETPLIRMALKSRPAIVYHSKSQIELYKQGYPELLRNSQYIRFGVDSEDFSPQNVEAENYVLSFGFYKRDYNTLISSWSKIQTDAQLKIIGIEGVSNEKIVYPGRVNVDKLKEEISKCLFVIIPLPVFNYSYGQMSFLQSMAMGKAVIVTETPSSTDYLIDGQGTYYVKPYDVDDLSEKISYLLSQRSMLPKLGLLARKQIENGLAEKEMALNIYNFIQSKCK